jgi:hypothetical protein
MAHQKTKESAFLAYGAPSVALFIGLQNCINSISSEKSIKESKNDIFAVILFLCSSCSDWGPREKSTPLQR